METDIQSDIVPSKVNSDEPKESKKARLGDNDEVIIPEEKNTPIDNLKKRRSSLRRSVNAGFTSTLIAASAAVSLLPPKQKKRRITELCLNQTIVDLKNNANEEEYEQIVAFEESLKEKVESILSKVEQSANENLQKTETQIGKHIKRLTEEKQQWNEEYKKRRQAQIDIKLKFRNVAKGEITIQEGKLKTEDIDFLNSLPDLTAVNKRLAAFQIRNCTGLVDLEKNARFVQNNLSQMHDRVDKLTKAITPSFDFPQ